MKLMGGCRIQKGKVIGWAKPVETDDSVMLEVSTAEGVLLWRGMAEVFRKDLKDKGIGHGNYGFSCPIPAHLMNRKVHIHVREAGSGQELPNSPIEIGDAFAAYRKRLLAKLAPPVWGLVSHATSNGQLTITGYLVAPEGQVDDYGIYVGGQRVGEMSGMARNLPAVSSLKENFWFSSHNEQLGFEVAVALDQVVTADPKDTVRTISVGVGKDTEEAADPLRIVWIPLLNESELVLPDDERRKRVQRNTSNLQFVTLGYTHYRYYRHLFEKYTGRAWNEIERMLDWGCGCGRVSQFFIQSFKENQFIGVDIDEDNVKWCKDHLAGGAFEASGLYPPLRFADNTFDFIVATSVFTHLDRATMTQWLEELSRVLKPNGIAALTVNTDCTPAWRSFDEKTLDLIKQEGIYDQIVSPDLGGHLSEEGYYKNVFMSKEFIAEQWGRYFDILNIHEHVFGYQDVVICQK